MANDIDKTSPHYKGEFGSIYEVNQKFPNGGVAGDYVEIDGWAHYWNADRGTWCVNAQRDSYWDELITGIIEKFKLIKGATYMGVAGLDTVPQAFTGAKMYYFATIAGTYKNFGGLVVPQGINVLYSENGSSWACSSLLEVTQEVGESEWKVVSQKVVNDALTKKANKADMDIELGKKFDKTSVTQDSGDSEELVMSQKAVSDKLSDLSKAAMYNNLKRLRRIPILNEEKCKNGGRYVEIENLILDLEIISNSRRNFAPVSFSLSGGNNISITFFEVDTDGHYLPTLKSFMINFKTKERTLLYVLDKEVSIDGYTAKVSIAIDSSAMTVDFDAYSPSFVSDSVHGEHWGLISILRMLQNTDTDVATLQDRVDKLYLYGNSLFQNLAETNQFLVTNGAQSSSDKYTGYITKYIPVKQGEKYRCFGDFNYTNFGGNVWGYSDTSGNGPVDLGHCMNGTGVTIEIPNNVNYIRMCSTKIAGQVPYIVPYPSMESYFGESIEGLNGSIEGLNGSIIPVSKPELVFGLESVSSQSHVTNVTTNSFVYDLESRAGNFWLDIKIGSLASLTALKDYNKCILLVTFDLEQLAGEDVMDHINIWRAGQSGYVEGKNVSMRSIQAGFAYYEAKLSSLVYPEGLHIWIEALGGTKWRISNFKITVAPSYDIIKGGSVNTALADVNTALADVNDTKQSRISLFDMEKCASNTRILQILDFLLDLELHWDDGQDDEVYALVSIIGGGESKAVKFYAVDENGKYLNTLHGFTLNFGKVTGVKYLLDQKITTNSGKTGTCSIVVDWDKWTFTQDAMNPCYHSNSIYSEHTGPIMYLRQLAGLGNQLAGLGNQLAGLGVQNVGNGEKVIYLTTANNTGSAVSNVTSNSFEISSDSTGYVWSYTAPPFTPSGNNYIHVKCKLNDLTPNLEGSSDVVTMWLSDGRSTYNADGCVSVGSFSTEIDYKFDPAYYTVYKKWTKFSVWLSISAGSSGGTKRWRVTDFEVYEVSEVVNGLSGNNAKELFEDVASKLSDINSEIAGLGEADTELISPSGNKFELSVQDDGTLKALPIIPNKGAFFGNSLLAGSGYGMAASDDQHDYYYLINSYIKSLNGSYTYNKYSSYEFEGISSEDAIENAVNAVVNNLTGDETLVSIQLGDNVNTTEKNAVFPASSLALCKAVRAKCPNARIVWMGMWYSSDSRYQAIQNACKQTGCKFISYNGLRDSDASSKIGNIQKKSSAKRTISDVINVVENSLSGSTKNITVTFTVSGSSYTSTLDVSDYSLNSGTMTYTSEYDIITSGGVASHPGDEGFRRISNRFLYEMKLTDDKEYYKKQ